MSSNPLFNFLASLPYICVLFNKRNVNKIPTHSGKLTANRSQLIYWENTFFCTIFRVFISSPGRKNQPSHCMPRVSLLRLHDEFMFEADLGLRRHRFGSLSSFMQIKATVGIKAQEVKEVL